MGADMTRLPGWERRLYALEQDNRQFAFCWGRHDCCTFAAAAVEAVTGQQICLPGPYGSARKALRVVRDMGGLPAAVSTILGFEPSPPLRAHRGDIVLLRQPGFDGHALGVCFGQFACAPGEDGLVTIQMTSPDVLAAWPIGH
jgi:hypothetical protein